MVKPGAYVAWLKDLDRDDVHIVGGKVANMGEMMDRIASFHDEEISRWVEWFTRLFEPILMAVIGLLIGGIVILMYMPIFELAGSL